MVKKKELERRIEGLYSDFSKLSKELATNGVVSDIVKLKEQVLPKKMPSSILIPSLYEYWFGGSTAKITLIEKVDAIIEYLGIKINVENKSEKVVVNKIKVPKKTKKGK